LVFGKIEYLNLLPFHIFMKRYLRSSQAKATMHYKGGVPSKINKDFKKCRVDAAFISSIEARGYNSLELGIVAKKEVLSVLVKPNTPTKKDSESATSNALADVLGIKGEIIIGDKALKYYLQNQPYIDLAKEWHNRYKLPFVFALLCFHKDKKFYKKIEKKFLQKNIKIPQYLLQQASKKTAIAPKDVLHYLKYISYNVDSKAKRSVKIFYKELQRRGK